jgi:hypothetical protein
MALLLIYDKDNQHGDPEKEYRGCWKKGYVVEVFEDDKPYVNPPAEPFVILEVTGVTKVQAEQYMASWTRAVDYAVIARNVSLDGWRLEIKSTNPNVSGKGHITREMVEGFIQRWNGSVVAFVNNGVWFDISIYLAATSEKFWGRNVSPIVFSETSYNKTTGVHRLSANYGAVAVPKGMTLDKFEEQFAHAVTEHGGTVASNSGGVIVFDLNRDTVINALRDDVKEAVQHVVCRRQRYLDPAFVDTIIANGRVMTATAAQVLGYVRDRLVE